MSFRAFVTSAVLGLAVAASANAAQGPFGVHMGMQKQELEKVVALRLSPDAAGRYMSPKAPVPNDAFDLYEYVISDDAGLCQVSAWTGAAEPATTDDTFHQLYGHLLEKYGKPARPKVGRSAVWHNQALPNRISSIGIEALEVEAGRKAFVRLVYSFENMSNCTVRPNVDDAGL